jgi:hypothetical protein
MTIETKFIYLQKQYMIKKGSNFESGLKNNTFSFNKNVLHRNRDNKQTCNNIFSSKCSTLKLIQLKN